MVQTFIGTSCLVLLLFLFNFLRAKHDTTILSSFSSSFSSFFLFSHMMKSFLVSSPLLLREPRHPVCLLYTPPVCLFVCVVPFLYKLFCFVLFVFLVVREAKVLQSQKRKTVGREVGERTSLRRQSGTLAVCQATCSSTVRTNCD